MCIYIYIYMCVCVRVKCVFDSRFQLMVMSCSYRSMLLQNSCAMSIFHGFSYGYLFSKAGMLKCNTITLCNTYLQPYCGLMFPAFRHIYVLHTLIHIYIYISNALRANSATALG